MNERNGERGLTLISMIIVLAVVGFFAYVGIRLFPVYSEYYGVLRAMKAVQATPGVAQMSPDKIWNALDKNFYTGYVTNVKRQHVTLTRQGGYTLRVAYEVRTPLLLNLDVVAKFDTSVELTRTGPSDS